MATSIEAGTHQPINLEKGITAAIDRSPFFLRSLDYPRERRISTFEVDSQLVRETIGASVLGPEDNPSVDVEKNARVTFTSGDSFKAVTISVFPNVLFDKNGNPKKGSAITSFSWRVVADNSDPKFTYTHGLETEPKDLDQEAEASLEKIIEASVPVERGIEDYTKELLWRMRMAGWSDRDIKRGTRAIKMADHHHKDAYRESGEPYVVHPWAVAMILWQECGIKDPDIIIPALIHDVPENSPTLRQPRIGNNPEKIKAKDWFKKIYLWLRRRVGALSAIRAMYMTRLQPDGVEEFSEDVTNSMYYEVLDQHPEVLLIKMSDRLHNSRTLRSMPIKNQIRTIVGTVLNYFPRFIKAKQQFPRETEYLMREIERSQRPLAAELGIDYDALLRKAGLASKII
ncbi:MAG: HD domain-containing protein [Candidatus Levybacteria bacterium]|nr:HD domain-containing protein [Candidatus Levybacteria bacterium]